MICSILALVKNRWSYAVEQLPRKFQDDRQRLDTTEVDLSIALIDIDHFKNYNDRYGHRAGDLILQEIARIFRPTVRRATRSIASVGKSLRSWSGDAQAAAYLLEKSKAHPLPRDHHGAVSITLSIGIAQRQRASCYSKHKNEPIKHCIEPRSGRDQLCLYYWLLSYFQKYYLKWGAHMENSLIMIPFARTWPQTVGSGGENSFA